MGKNNETSMDVRRVMQDGVAAVSPELPISSLQELFTGGEFSGAPVIDQNGELQGIVSKTDIVTFLTTNPTILSDEALTGVTVEEIMTRDVLTVEIDEPVALVARKMVEGSVHRVIVVDSERVRGIVTTLDLLRLMY